MAGFLYTTSVYNSGVATNIAYAEFRVPAASKAYVREIRFENDVASPTITKIALGRAGAQGTGGGNSPLMTHDPAQPAPKAAMWIPAFTLAPTAATVYMRRHAFGGKDQSIKWLWTPGRELRVAASTSLVVWNVSAGTLAGQISVVWEE